MRIQQLLLNLTQFNLKILKLKTGFELNQIKILN
jgi:hypothetical protein